MLQLVSGNIVALIASILMVYSGSIKNIVYTCFMDVKNTIKLKLLIIFTMIMWLIYDILIRSYTSSIFDLLNILANTITIYQLSRKK